MAREVNALLLDLSGVVYEGDQVIGGAREVIAEARARGLVLRFVTNTATRSGAAIESGLHRMGIELKPGELITAPMAAHAYIKQQGLRPYCLLHPNLQPEFADLPRQNPDCVVLGDARDDLNYANLNRAFRLCQKGAPLIGIGMNRYFKDSDGLKLDAGPFIRALAWAAEVEPVIMGKPSADFFHQVVASTGVPAQACLMVGDDVAADVAGAVAAGLQGCLVQTGKYQPGDEGRLPATARMVASIADVPALI
ncbi:MAG: TIGR01458 family HAD-type hydrolase [Pseudomonadales bacterium]|nr:TIGR01458 family HAD-type hydrolase [Pseudomonadales bacterium]